MMKKTFHDYISRLFLGFLYFYQCSCLNIDCPKEEIAVYNPEDMNQEIIFENGQIIVLEEEKEKKLQC